MRPPGIFRERRNAIRSLSSTAFKLPPSEGMFLAAVQDSNRHLFGGEAIAGVGQVTAAVTSEPAMLWQYSHPFLLKRIAPFAMCSSTARNTVAGSGWAPKSLPALYMELRYEQ